MGKSIFHVLSVAALLAAMAAPAVAQVAIGADVDLYYNPSYVAVSNSGNSFTFASAGPYAPDGNWTPGIYKDLFIVNAHEGKALTGNMSMSFQASYQLAAPPLPWPYQGDYTGSFSSTIDVLKPNCDSCGPLDSMHLGQIYAGDGAQSPLPTGGTLTGSASFTGAAGNYDTLFAYAFNYYNLNTSYGSVNLTSFTLSFETVPQASPVPELPPVAMLSLGLAALAMRVRYVKARRAVEA